MKSLLSLFLIIGFAIPSLGQTGVDFDEFGVYFDESGETYSTTADPNSVVNAYLILRNPSESGDIRFWSAVVSGHPEQGYFGPAVISGQPQLGYNDWNPMPGENDIAFYVFCDGPQFPSLEPVTVLADLQIHLFGEVDPFQLFLVGDVVYSREVFSGWGQDSLVYGGPVSGDSYLPVASINGAVPVLATQSTWGGVKALFRN